MVKMIVKCCIDLKERSGVGKTKKKKDKKEGKKKKEKWRKEKIKGKSGVKYIYLMF